MSVISERVSEAIEYLKKGDLENALIYITIALDRTAKNNWNKLGVGRRIKKFVEEYQFILVQFATNGKLYNYGKLVIGGLEVKDIVYMIRCYLQHGDDLNSKFTLVMQDGILGIKDGKTLINRGLIYGLLLSVIVDKSNKNEYCSSGQELFFGNIKVEINKLWGKINLIENLTGYRVK